MGELKRIIGLVQLWEISVESEQNFCLDKFGLDRNSVEEILVCVRLISGRVMCNWVLFI